MSILFVIVLIIGIFFGVWGWIVVLFGLFLWVGFFGCMSYFVFFKDGLKGLG